MYADDLALLSMSVEGLRRQMAVLEDYAKRWGLTINVSKTKAMMFSHRKVRGAEEIELQCAGGQVEVVDTFKYLGVNFHCSSSFGDYAASARGVSGRKAWHNTIRRMNTLKLSAPKVQNRLFDVMVETVLSYGAEVWAPELLCRDPCSNPCEKVHLAFLRRLLGVRKGTANLVVLAETGRWPLALRWAKRLIRFFNKVVSSPREGLLFRALRDSCGLAEGATGLVSRRSWAAQVDAALRQWGLQINLGNPQKISVSQLCAAWHEEYLTAARERTGTKTRHYMHEVRGGLPSSEYTLPQYMSDLPRFVQRFRLSQLRVGSHWLREETGRWERLEREARTCPSCANRGEQEVQTLEHVLFQCPETSELRGKYECLEFSGGLCEFFQQKPSRLGSFARACWDLHNKVQPPVVS